MTVHWGVAPMVCHEAWVTVVGVEGRSGKYFDPQGVLPVTRLPTMNSYEKAQMLVALRDALEKEIGLNIRPIPGTVVDWDGQEDDL